MGVVVDVGRDRRVVVVPLLARDLAVAVTVAEGGQELHKHLLVSHLAAHHLRVLAAVVHDAQVRRVHDAAAVRIELDEALVDDCLPGSVRGAADAIEELVVADHAVLVRVQVFQEQLRLPLGNGRAKVHQTPVELLFIDLAVTVVVHDAERAAHAANGPHTAGIQTGLHLFED